MKARIIGFVNIISADDGVARRPAAGVPANAHIRDWSKT